MGELKVLKVDTKPSNYGGVFHYIYFKQLKDGKSARTCVQNTNGNYRRWDKIVQMAEDGTLGDYDVIVKGAIFRNKSLVDADSDIRIQITPKQNEFPLEFGDWRDYGED